jgi:hypothetical protein
VGTSAIGAPVGRQRTAGTRSRPERKRTVTNPDGTTKTTWDPPPAELQKSFKALLQPIASWVHAWPEYVEIKTSMPEGNPGNLSQESTANVIAYILEMNKVSSGTKDLPVDQAALSQIRIVEQAPQK